MPPDFYVESLVPSTSDWGVFWKRGLYRNAKVKTRSSGGGGPLPVGLGSFYEVERRPKAHTQGQAHQETEGDQGCRQAQGTGLGFTQNESALHTPPAQTYSVHSCQKAPLGGVRCPGCGPRSQQPRHIQTGWGVADCEGRVKVTARNKGGPCFSVQPAGHHHPVPCSEVMERN